LATEGNVRNTKRGKNQGRDLAAEREGNSRKKGIAVMITLEDALVMISHGNWRNK